MYGEKREGGRRDYRKHERRSQATFLPTSLHYMFKASKRQGQGQTSPSPLFVICSSTLRSVPSPQLSSLLPLRRVPSPRAVIKTTGGIRNAAWLLPACNRRHLDHKRGGGVLPPHPPRLKTSKVRIFDRTPASSRAKGNIIHCLSDLSATQSVKWKCEPEHVSHQVG